MVIFAVLLKARAEVPGPILLSTPKAGVQRRIKILEKRFMRIPNGRMRKTNATHEVQAEKRKQYQ
jgi:hypothetical protein